MTEAYYRLLVSGDRTILVRIWLNGNVEVCRRSHPDAVWGPPLALIEEKV